MQIVASRGSFRCEIFSMRGYRVPAQVMCVCVCILSPQDPTGHHNTQHGPFKSTMLHARSRYNPVRVNFARCSDTPRHALTGYTQSSAISLIPEYEEFTLSSLVCTSSTSPPSWMSSSMGKPLAHPPACMGWSASSLPHVGKICTVLLFCSPSTRTVQRWRAGGHGSSWHVRLRARMLVV
jgi:hypothetical protein